MQHASVIKSYVFDIVDLKSRKDKCYDKVLSQCFFRSFWFKVPPASFLSLSGLSAEPHSEMSECDVVRN